MKYFFSLFFVLSSAIAMAQPMKMTTAKMLATADKAAMDSNHFKALEWYQKAYNKSSDTKLLARLADMNQRLRDYGEATKLYAQYLKTNVEDYQQRLNYANSLKLLGRYDEAQQQLEIASEGGADKAFLKKIKQSSAGIELAQTSQADKLVNINNAGEIINTANSEYSPFLDGDGNLYFSSLGKNGIIEQDGDSQLSNYGSKIMMASPNGLAFTVPTLLGTAINSDNAFNSNVRLSRNGEEMLLVRQQLGAGNQLVESNIYYSKKVDGVWTTATPLTDINDGSINKSAAFGELYGKPVIFFVSDRVGGQGGYDIYYVTCEDNGKCDGVVNLGKRINTAMDEESPFFQDGNLYFSSNGRMTMGGYDIYHSEWNGTDWSKANNLGKPYNSSADDLYFMLDLRGDKGVLASNRPDTKAQSLKSETCCNDIYLLDIKRVEVNLQVKVLDAATGLPLTEGFVRLMPSSKELKPLEQSNTAGNTLTFPLTQEEEYSLVATVEGYSPGVVNFNVPTMDESTVIEKVVQLEPIVKIEPEPEPEYVTVTREEAITLENILYDYNDDKITALAENDLRLLYDLLVQYPDMVIELSSHTDGRGTASYNQNLSQRRADSAVRWLVAKGIASNRLQAKGYGSNEPKVVGTKINSKYSFLPIGQKLTLDYINQLSDKDLQEIAHQLNRRTEFKIISGPTSIRIEERKLKKQ